MNWSRRLCPSARTALKLLAFLLPFEFLRGQAVWSIAFAQEQFIASAALLSAIAASLGMCVVGLAPYKADLFASVTSLEYWVVHFPIGLHAGWTCAGKFPS